MATKQRTTKPELEAEEHAEASPPSVAELRAKLGNALTDLGGLASTKPLGERIADVTGRCSELVLLKEALADEIADLTRVWSLILLKQSAASLNDTRVALIQKQAQVRPLQDAIDRAMAEGARLYALRNAEQANERGSQNRIALGDAATALEHAGAHLVAILADVRAKLLAVDGGDAAVALLVGILQAQLGDVADKRLPDGRLDALNRGMQDLAASLRRQQHPAASAARVDDRPIARDTVSVLNTRVKFDLPSETIEAPPGRYVLLPAAVAAHVERNGLGAALSWDPTAIRVTATAAFRRGQFPVRVGADLVMPFGELLGALESRVVKIVEPMPAGILLSEREVSPFAVDLGRFARDHAGAVVHVPPAMAA